MGGCVSSTQSPAAKSHDAPKPETLTQPEAVPKAALESVLVPEDTEDATNDALDIDEENNELALEDVSDVPDLIDPLVVEYKGENEEGEEGNEHTNLEVVESGEAAMDDEKAMLDSTIGDAEGPEEDLGPEDDVPELPETNEEPRMLTIAERKALLLGKQSGDTDFSSFTGSSNQEKSDSSNDSSFDAHGGRSTLEDVRKDREARINDLNTTVQSRKLNTKKTAKHMEDLIWISQNTVNIKHF
ncbi:Hypothetical Protein FCC1311_047522 [Hondaea fermentalgiana]|uniref:Uncharacterized protein n=1 Tax=Hondaea fermentalgiana TaxID=2315210 RepID=A0A2R5GDW9_9STRA|nr:Hypothetical Protein FCC1311_047522 [Hondaea fermentalgiana]|eukprot:GBG28529.1 Hypothetical Protein FCC1311_047522 [Hondaea fermentalgiana]